MGFNDNACKDGFVSAGGDPFPGSHGAAQVTDPIRNARADDAGEGACLGVVDQGRGCAVATDELVGVDEDVGAQCDEGHGGDGVARNRRCYPDGGWLWEPVLLPPSRGGGGGGGGRFLVQDVVGVKLVDAVPAFPVIQRQIQVPLARRPLRLRLRCVIINPPPLIRRRRRGGA
ncbi:hypothetical protein U9M48_012354 [Paspalum notatum var. saurae]|uniref:Uncharacterized protein n=1 Tax=Paspalum notatum var. saurae TaxID=547442 RepID=A0AAQ3SXF1_PASNO